MAAELSLAPPPGAPATVTLEMPAASAARLQQAIEFASARLARGRGRSEPTVENIRWLDWGSCVIAGQVGIAPPAPRVEEAPAVVLAPGEVLRDARGYARPPQSTPGHRKGVAPKSKGRRYEADPPSTGEIVRFLEACPDNVYGRRMRALVAVLWRSGLRISEALALEARDLRREKGQLVVRHGKGDKRRIVGMDPFGWSLLEPWLLERGEDEPGPIFPVLTGPTAGRAWDSSSVRKDMAKIQRAAGIRRRFRPHQLRHRLTLDWISENQSLVHLQRQLGHSDLGVTTTYTAGLSPEEVTEVSASRPTPVLSVNDLMEAHRA